MGAIEGLRLAEAVAAVAPVTAPTAAPTTPNAPATAPLRSAIAHLLADPHRFGFMQAVRLIERWQAGRGADAPQALMARTLRFRNALSMAFPPSEIAEFRVVTTPGAPNGPGAPGALPSIERIEITPAFMGLLGAGGALPAFYTELFAQQEQFQRDHSARRFLDIFVHRAVALFYGAWRKHRLALRHEAESMRPPTRGRAFHASAADDALSQVLALAGFGQPALRRRLRASEGGVADAALAHFAGLLRQRPVSLAAIGQVLAGYFGVPVRLEPFVGRWFTLPADQCSVLGLGACTLGAGAVAGERVWQRDLRLRLHIGPLGRAAFDRFLPGGPARLALGELLKLLTGVALEYEVRLTLRAADVAPAHLGAAAAGPRLGWDGFLLTRPSTTDRSDAGYDLLALA